MTSALIMKALLTWPRATLIAMAITLPRVDGLRLAVAAPAARWPWVRWGRGRPGHERTAVRRPATRPPPRGPRWHPCGPGRRPARWCHARPGGPGRRPGAAGP